VIATTVGTEEQANLLAEEIVSRRHAACVNIVPIHRSVYRWQGKICDDSEFLLIIKTVDTEYANVEATIQELHQYDLPEILAFNVSKGETNFLRWISESVDKELALLEDESGKQAGSEPLVE
jgi:periplasmic divalent cation tolerance protein